jgi:hypothetical protein
MPGGFLYEFFEEVSGTRLATIPPTIDDTIFPFLAPDVIPQASLPDESLIPEVSFRDDQNTHEYPCQHNKKNQSANANTSSNMDFDLRA